MSVRRSSLTARSGRPWQRSRVAALGRAGGLPSGAGWSTSRVCGRTSLPTVSVDRVPGLAAPSSAALAAPVSAGLLFERAAGGVPRAYVRENWARSRDAGTCFGPPTFLRKWGRRVEVRCMPDFYVDVATGNDANPGSAGRPLRSIKGPAHPPRSGPARSSSWARCHGGRPSRR